MRSLSFSIRYASGRVARSLSAVRSMGVIVRRLRGSARSWDFGNGDRTPDEASQSHRQHRDQRGRVYRAFRRRSRLADVLFIGEGIPLIARRHRHVPLELRSVERFEDGPVQLHYCVQNKQS